MTPQDREPSHVGRFHLRLLAASLLLVGLAMTQSPGLLVPDTKLDLALAPLDFLRRAAHLWDAEGAFGQLQNQAYGYLWPMGPFFAVGTLLDLPGWVVQRLWLALVLVVAFVGAAKLARAMGVRSDFAVVVAAFAYALSPRMLTVLGPISIEAWPSALAPWVLLPLVVGATRGSPRRAAALAGLGVAMVGGVNAAATSAVLPLGVVWLLTRTSGPRRRALMLWWPVFTVLGTLWWLVPLFLMAAYSPPFLDFIESASVTTIPTNLFDALRGTSNWVPYVDTHSRAGNDLLRDFYLVVNSAVLLVFGLVGMMLRTTRERLFLASGLVAGLLLVTMGHTGAVQGWWAPEVQDLLDGALAPLRNVHKFDPVVRLPLVLGLAWAVDSLVGQARSLPAPATWDRLNLRVLAGIAAFAVLGAAMPAAVGRITPAGGFQDVPDYWREAAAWLADEQEERVTLMVPGSSFGEYVWGRPQDEPLQSLAEQPWAVRNAVPLTPAGNIRMLDAIEERLAAGEGSAGLATYLRRAGVSHLLVRNDLVRSADVPDPVLVHQALEDTPGLTRLATFGPDIGGDPVLEEDEDGQRVLVNGGWQTRYPALEVWGLVDTPSYAVALGDSSPVVVGGPEDLLDLADLGVLADEPVRLATDLASAGEPVPDGAPVVLTDGMRLVERNFGRVHEAASQTRTLDEERRLGLTQPDYVMADPERWSTRAEHVGIEDVTASSARSFADSFGDVVPGHLPWAALDGHEETHWLSNRLTGSAHWWEVRLSRPLTPGTITLRGARGTDQEVVVSTDGWRSDPVRLRSDSEVTVPVTGQVSRLRVTDSSGRTATPLALAEVDVPGLSTVRRLVVPEVPPGTGAPDVVALRAVDDSRTGCAEVDGAVRCVADRDVPGEEPLGFRRVVTIPEPADYEPVLTVAGRPGPALDRTVLEGLGLDVSVSSTANPDVRAGAVAAVDGDPGTTWTATPGDFRPWIRLSWLGERAVRGLAMSRTRESAGRLPEEVEIRWPGGRRTLEIASDGTATFPAIRTDQLTIRVLEAEPATSLDFAALPSTLPVGVGELRLTGVPFFPIDQRDTALDLPCGSGPAVRVNGLPVETKVVATRRALRAGEPVEAEVCDGNRVDLRAGANEVVVLATEAFTPRSLVLNRAGTPAAAGYPLAAWLPDATHRRVEPLPGAGLALRENVNPGWVADQGGDPMEAAVVDGWRQAWSSTSGDSMVDIRFAPNTSYRVGLVAGLVFLMLLMAGMLVPVGRGRRTGEPAALVERVVHPVLLLPGVVAVGGVLAGTVGAAVVTGSLVLGLLLRRWAPTVGPGLLAATLVPAAAAYVVRPWGDASGWAGDLAWPSYLVLVPVAGAVAWLTASSRRRHASLRRRPGSSTKR